MSTDTNSSASSGISLASIVGGAIAAICSWTINHSILWAAFHAIFWPFYLMYLCMGCGGGFPVLPW